MNISHLCANPLGSNIRNKTIAKPRITSISGASRLLAPGNTTDKEARIALSPLFKMAMNITPKKAPVIEPRPPIMRYAKYQKDCISV